jgi:hypothetical protein
MTVQLRNTEVESKVAGKSIALVSNEIGIRPGRISILHSPTLYKYIPQMAKHAP